MTSPVRELDIELAEVEAQEAQLRQEAEELNRRRFAAQQKQRELLARRAAAIEAEANGRPTELRICDINEKGIINVKVIPDMRPDILPIIRGIPGRVWDVTVMVNRIPIEGWMSVQETLRNLPGVSITHTLGMDTKLNRFINKPEFQVMILGKELRIACHPKSYRGGILALPGAAWHTNNVDLKLPLSEAWRLLDVFEHYNRLDGMKGGAIEWNKDALELAERELRKRAALDEILLLQDAPEIEPPFVKGQQLMPFQRVGVKAITATDGIAFLCDQMGLGKTWQSIAYAILSGSRVVVVCPAHLKANWMREIINLTGVVPAMLFGREPDANDVQTLLVAKPRFAIINYDIIGAKTEMPATETTDDKGDIHIKPPYIRYLWADLINMSKPDLVVLDEAHFIKNSSAHRSKACTALVAPHRLPMTGTPILNRPGEFYPALHWLLPDVFPSEEKFLYQYTNGGKGAKNVTQLRELLKPVMIRRLKKEVVADLPPINRIVRTLELSNEGKMLYAEVLKGVYKAIDDAGDQVERSITSILVRIGKLKEVCSLDAVPSVVDHARDLLDSEEDDRGQGKILIFAQYKETVRAIASQLSCPFWTGDTPFDQRNLIERRFQEDDSVRFLVVSLMTGQTGLNLTAAGHVIFADLYWTPAAHAQAEERAYGRLSDLHGADSYYFMAKDTIMEWVWNDVIQPKIAMINEVVEGINEERDVGAIMKIIGRFKALKGATL